MSSNGVLGLWNIKLYSKSYVIISCVKWNMNKEIHGRWQTPQMGPNICHILKHKVKISKPLEKIIMHLYNSNLEK